MLHLIIFRTFKLFFMKLKIESLDQNSEKETNEESGEETKLENSTKVQVEIN